MNLRIRILCFFGTLMTLSGQLTISNGDRFFPPWDSPRFMSRTRYNNTIRAQKTRSVYLDRLLQLVDIVLVVQLDIMYLNTLPETKSSHLKIDSWKTILSFWEDLFSDAMFYSGRVLQLIPETNFDLHVCLTWSSDLGTLCLDLPRKVRLIHVIQLYVIITIS